MLPLPQLNHQSVAAFQRQIRRQRRLETVNRRKFKGLQEARQHHFHLQHGVPLADAVAMAGAKVERGVRMNGVGEEAFGPKDEWIAKVLFLAMDVIGWEVDGHISGQRVFA